MSKRILVVEDQEDSRRILRDLLTSADYEMTEAVNGEQAIAAGAAMVAHTAIVRLIKEAAAKLPD